MTHAIPETADRLSRIPGVRGALVVDTDAGVPVASMLEGDVDGGAVAALAASLFQRTSSAARTAGLERLETLQLEAARGHVLAADAGELAVVAVATGDAQLGLVRLETRRAAEAIR